MKVCLQCSCRTGPDDLPCPNGCILVDNSFKKDTLEVLKGIINGRVHPDVAIRAVFVDLSPIRELLKKYEN